MNHSRILIFLVLFFWVINFTPKEIFAAQSILEQTNLVPNSGFENGSSAGWACEWGNGISVINGAGYSGGYGLYVSPKPSLQKLFYRLVNVQANKTYLLSAMVRLANSADNGAVFEMYPGASVERPYRTMEKLVASAEEWRRVTLTIRTNAAATLYFSVANWSNPNIAYYIDDVYVGELCVTNAEVVGENIIKIPENGTNDIQLNANLYNQFGSTNGLYEENNMDEWYIEGNPDGITASQTGLVSVDYLATAGSITVCAKKYSSVMQNGYVIKSFPIEIIPCDTNQDNGNLIANSGFEEYEKLYWDYNWENGMKILSRKPYSGMFSAYISSRTSENDRYSQAVTLLPNKIYYCSAMIHPQGATEPFTFRVGNSSLEPCVTQNPAETAPNGWKRVSATIDTRAFEENSIVHLSVMPENLTTEFYADDYYLGESEIPAIDHSFDANIAYLMNNNEISGLKNGTIQTKIRLRNDQSAKNVHIYSVLYDKTADGLKRINEISCENILLGEYMESDATIPDSLSVTDENNQIIKTFIWDNNHVPLFISDEFAKSEIISELFISTTGDDTGAGTLEHPYATITRARDRIREIKSANGLPPEGITVYLRGGEYYCSQSVTLSSADSGTTDSPITYQAYNNEKVVLTGGVNIPANGFASVTDSNILSRIIDENARQQIKQINLIDLGITNYGELSLPGAYSLPWMTKNPTQAELFVDDEAMTLARYPNTGYMGVTQVVDPGAYPRMWEADKINDPEYVPPASRDREDTFVIQPNDERLLNWSHAPGGSVLLYGNWRWLWADQTVPLKTINTQAKTLESSIPSYYSVTKNARFYAYNLLEEIDMPGEYYIDRSSGMLYLYPKNMSQTSQVRLSLLKDTFITLNNVANVTIDGLYFTSSRGMGLNLSGCNQVKIKDCTLENLGDKAISVGSGNYNCGVCGGYIHNTNGGVILYGGDMTTLTNGNNYVENCHIEKFARLTKTYNGAVTLGGAGNRITNNKIHDGPHLAIQMWGNNHKIEKNEIYDVLKETDDMSVIYAGRSWVQRGNELNYNYIHDIYSDTSGPSAGVHAFYLDDCYSGTIMKGNVISNVSGYGFLVNGGRDNVMYNNIMANVGGGLLMTDIGLSQDMINHYNSLASVPYRNALWKSAYPKLYCILENEPNKPKGNVFKNNIMINCGENGFWGITGKLINAENNYSSNNDPGFLDFANDNFLLQTNSIVFNMIRGFKQIPFEQIGLPN